LSPAEVTGHPQKGRIWLSVNGEMKQDGDLAELIWPLADIVAICSEAVELKAGDLIFTGTPAGVGPLVAGDRVSAGVDGVGTLDFTVGPPT
jgi:fumarylpyruvate hydrolase